METNLHGRQPLNWYTDLVNTHSFSKWEVEQMSLSFISVKVCMATWRRFFELLSS
jgi:hypothetical protein